MARRYSVSMHQFFARMAISLAFVSSVVGFAGAASADCGSDPQSCAAPFGIDGLSLRLYASLPLGSAHPEIRRAVVIVHGNEGNAEGYFKAALAAAEAAKAAGDSLILAPHFIEQADKAVPPAGQLLWDRGGDWRAGYASSAQVRPRISSFTVMDRLVELLSDKTRYPNLAGIVIAGHSAGGQYVQRYAILSGDRPAGAPPLRFVVANPSSYLYLDARRPDPTKPGAFSVPPDGPCATNHYKYGLERGVVYVEGAIKSVGLASIAARFQQRPVTYLLGENDNDPNHRLLDKDCAAMAQGPTRLARGLAFKLYLESFYAPNVQRFETVPGVGHNAARMFRSPAGLAALFPDI